MRTNVAVGVAFALAAAVGVAGLDSSSPVTAAPASGAWPEIRGGSARTGWNRSETAISWHTITGLTLRWTDTAPSVGEPIVDGSMVYSFTYASSQSRSDTTLRALDAATGTLRWTAPHVRAVVSNGATVYLVMREYTVDQMYADHLEARRSTVGSVLWSMPLGVFDLDEGLSMTLHQGWLAIDCSTGQWFVNPKTKELFRRGQSCDPDGYYPIVSAANGVLYTFATPTQAVPFPGQPEFTFTHRYAGWLLTPPLIVKGRLYQGGNRGLVVTDLHGQVLASRNDLGARFAALATSGYQVYVATRDEAGLSSTLYAMTLSQLSTNWSVRSSGVMAAPAVADWLVFSAAGRDGLAAYYAVDGTQVWSRPGSATGAAPVISSGRLVVGYSPKAGVSDAPLSLFSLA